MTTVTEGSMHIALKNERERCAKIVEEAFDGDGTIHTLATIAAKIRGGKEQIELSEAEKLDEALVFLRKAREELPCYWFHDSDDGESYNNDEVIDLTREIDAFIAKTDGSERIWTDDEWRSVKR